MRSLGWPSSDRTAVLTRGKHHVKIQTHRKKARGQGQRLDRGRCSQGAPETNGHHRQPSRRKEGLDPESQREGRPAATLTSDFWPPDCERRHFCFRPPGLCFTMAAPGNIHTVSSLTCPEASPRHPQACRVHRLCFHFVNGGSVTSAQARQHGDTFTASLPHAPHPDPLFRAVFRACPSLITSAGTNVASGMTVSRLSQPASPFPASVRSTQWPP